MEVDEKEEDSTPSKLFTIEILRVIKDLQLQHGLRHGDYQRYRGYCSRRVKRLRKTLNLPQGDKRHFKKRDVTLANLERENSDERFIHIPLMLAERAWAYAMQLRQEANTEPRKRFHLVRKLRKATVYALQLQELCNSWYCDARTKLEAEAYSAWIHGSLHFKLSLWKKAAENLKKAQTKTESMEAFQTTEWRGQKVTVRPEKVRLFLLSIQDLTNNIEKAKDFPAKIELLENVLLDCKDAISAIKDEIKQDPKLRTTNDSGTMTATQYLLTYLPYTRLKLTLERNLFMVAQGKLNLDDPNAPEKVQIEGKKTKPQDLSRLYEIILQNVTEMQQLPGMESDAQYQAEIENLALSFKSFRSYYIAITLVALKRWRDAVAMYERSTKYQATTSNKSVCKDFDLRDDLQRLIQTIEGCKFSAHANSVLEEDTTEESVLYGKSTKPSKPLFERLSVYKEDPTLTSRNPNVFKLTPEMQPIPAKPLFFDLALNFVEFPSLEDKIEQKGGAKQAAGMSGFVKGLFGWGGSGGK